MEVFYDLSKSPVTHDIVYFLARAEDLRVGRGEPDLQIRIVDGNRNLTPRDQLYSVERKRWRVDNLLYPVCRLLPSVTDVSFGVGEQTIPYSAFDKPRAPVFGAPVIALNIVSRFLENIENPVTITIRQTDFQAIRNSRFKEWAEVARWLYANGYTPIFIPDIEAEMDGTTYQHEFTAYRPAAYNHALRLALYELSVVNLMTSGGFFGMGMLCDIPLMAFKLATETIPACTSAYLTRISLTPEADWGAYKKLYWEQDIAAFITQQLDLELPKFVERQKPVADDVLTLRRRTA